MYWVQNKQYIDIYEHTRRRCGFEGRTSLHTSKKKKTIKSHRKFIHSISRFLQEHI